MARDSIGSAVEVAARIGGPEGDALLLAARSSFIAAMHSAVLVGTGVALLGAVVALTIRKRSGSPGAGGLRDGW